MGRLNDQFIFQEGGVGGITGLLNYIQATGENHVSRLGVTSELMGAKLVTDTNYAPYRPGMARKLGWVELLQVISGYFDERHIAKAAPSLRYPYGLAHAYGIKVAQQLPKVIQQLRDNPGTRRATVYIGKPEDGQETTKPCIQAYQFQIRESKLYTTVWTRSWDACSGLPYDILVANGIAQMIATLLGDWEATTTFFASSLHVYTLVWEELKKRHPTKMTINPPFSHRFSLPEFDTFDKYREWAMDELNSIDNWEHGLPGGVS